LLTIKTRAGGGGVDGDLLLDLRLRPLALRRDREFQTLNPESLLVWFVVGFGLVSGWFRVGFGFVSDWFWVGFSLVSGWFWFSFGLIVSALWPCVAIVHPKP
jgi:hypothetical protein